MKKEMQDGYRGQSPETSVLLPLKTGLGNKSRIYCLLQAGKTKEMDFFPLRSPKKLNLIIKCKK